MTMTELESTLGGRGLASETLRGLCREIFYVSVIVMITGEPACARKRAPHLQLKTSKLCAYLVPGSKNDQSSVFYSSLGRRVLILPD